MGIKQSIPTISCLPYKGFSWPLSGPVIFKVLFEREVRKIAVFFYGQDPSCLKRLFEIQRELPLRVGDLTYRTIL